MKIGVTGSARTTQNFVCFATKKLLTERAISDVNDFLDQTSRVPSRIFKGLKMLCLETKSFVDGRGFNLIVLSICLCYLYIYKLWAISFRSCLGAIDIFVCRIKFNIFCDKM